LISNLSGSILAAFQVFAKSFVRTPDDEPSSFAHLQPRAYRVRALGLALSEFRRRPQRFYFLHDMNDLTVRSRMFLAMWLAAVPSTCFAQTNPPVPPEAELSTPLPG
jgi:hypothetical protein